MTKVSGYSAKDTKSFRDAGLDAGTPTQIVHEHQDGLHILVWYKANECLEGTNTRPTVAKGLDTKAWACRELVAL